MEAVAHHLQIEAVNRTQAEDKDQFGRSSFNRYYYGTYLIVRDQLSQINSGWKGLPHSNFPTILKDSVVKDLARAREKAQKIRDPELVNKCNIAIHAANELADLMRTAYASRVAADYNPEIRIQFGESGRFKLNSIDITSAHNWPSRAKTLSSSILSAWRQINA